MFSASGNKVCLTLLDRIDIFWNIFDEKKRSGWDPQKTLKEKGEIKEVTNVIFVLAGRCCRRFKFVAAALPFLFSNFFEEIHNCYFGVAVKQDKTTGQTTEQEEKKTESRGVAETEGYSFISKKN